MLPNVTITVSVTVAVAVAVSVTVAVATVSFAVKNGAQNGIHHQRRAPKQYE